MSEQNHYTGASIVICCYNSAGRLPETIRHLANLYCPDNFSIELVLVNNASTDNTEIVAEQIWDSVEHGNKVLRIAREQKAGQMHARLSGVAFANYELIIFCDDDNWLDRNYVQEALKLMVSQPGAGACGGFNIPVTDADGYPDWFQSFKAYYAISMEGQLTGDCTDRGYVLGAGMVTTKSLFLQMFNDLYPTLLAGRDGEKLSTGDDFEYCKRLLLRDYRLFSNNNMILQHFIPKERLTIPYRDRLMAGIAASREILDEYDRAILVRKKSKYKNRWRLIFMGMLRVPLSKLGWIKRNYEEERLLYFYLSPFGTTENNDQNLIKKFISRK